MVHLIVLGAGMGDRPMARECRIGLKLFAEPIQELPHSPVLKPEKLP
jgi:hypothetical protein